MSSASRNWRSVARRAPPQTRRPKPHRRRPTIRRRAMRPHRRPTGVLAPWPLARAVRLQPRFPGSGTWGAAGRPRQYHCRSERQHPGRHNRRACRRARRLGKFVGRHQGCGTAGHGRPGRTLPQFLPIHPVGRLQHGGGRFPRSHRALPGRSEGLRRALLAGRIVARPAKIPRCGGSIPCGKPRLSGFGARRRTCC